jgi:hypothetical protein
MGNGSKDLQGGNTRRSVVLGRQLTDIPQLPPQPSHPEEHATLALVKWVDASHAQE